MGLFSKLFKGPEPDMEKSAANAKKVRALFDQAVEHGEEYRLIVGYTEDVKRFNYGFVHGSKTQIGNLILGWNAATRTIVVVPTLPDLSGYGDPTYYRRDEIFKAYRNKYPTDAFIIYPNRKEYIGSTPMNGWRMRACIFISIRKRSWRRLPPSSRMSFQSQISGARGETQCGRKLECGS